LEQEEAAIKLLKAIHKNPELSQRDLSKSIGISVGKTNYIIKALIDKCVIASSASRSITQL